VVVQGTKELKMATCQAVDQVYKCCKVGVIGAGAAGLAAAKELIREGHKVIVFEQAMKVGGLWVYDPKVDSDLLGVEPHRKHVHSSVYASLRTNLPREVMSFVDFPFLTKQGRDERCYPSHKEVALYLEDFAKEFDLLHVIQFGTFVEHVELVTMDSTGQKGWKVMTTKRIDGVVGEVKEELFDAVVVCSGHYFEPKIANIPGIFIVPILFFKLKLYAKICDLNSNLTQL
jgi:cation diffusion facilitator CzcD-associated flavoprotein CzcO